MSSSQERAIVSLLSEVAFSFDGAFLGVALAFAAVRTVLKYVSNSAALCKVREVPYVTVSGLRSILESENYNESQPSNGKLVIVRGTVDTEGSWNSLKTNVLVSQESGHRAVAIQRTLTVCAVGLVWLGTQKKKKKSVLFVLNNQYFDTPW